MLRQSLTICYWSCPGLSTDCTHKKLVLSPGGGGVGGVGTGGRVCVRVCTWIRALTTN